MKVTDITVEITKKGEPVDPGDMLHEFKGAWQGFETQLSAYNADFRVGTETTVKLTFDRAANVQGAFKTETSDWDVKTGTGEEITFTATPKEDYINIQITDMAGESSIRLLKIEVLQESAPEPEALHEFTEAWAGFETQLSEYNADFRTGVETTVKLTFDKEAKAQGAFKTEASSWDVKAGTGEEVTLTATPKEDYINIQITDMNGASSIKLLNIVVEQSSEAAEALQEEESSEEQQVTETEAKEEKNAILPELSEELSELTGDEKESGNDQETGKSETSKKEEDFELDGMDTASEGEDTMSETEDRNREESEELEEVSGSDAI